MPACGYYDPEKCKQNHLEGAVDYGMSTSRLPSISYEQEIILYLLTHNSVSHNEYYN